MASDVEKTRVMLQVIREQMKTNIERFRADIEADRRRIEAKGRKLFWQLIGTLVGGMIAGGALVGLCLRHQ